MTSIINASPSNGITQTADGSGVIKVQSNGVTTNALAWVNFNGTLSGTITPRANYNVGSVTKNSTGDYTINFTSALSDANYVVCGTAGDYTGGTQNRMTIDPKVFATGSLRINVDNSASTTDQNAVCVAIFGN